jgi:DNA-directed RNA polymerase subunit RPC12/RpoP
MAACVICGEQATDPGRGPSRWVRAVIGSEQVLVCPDCQRAHPEWVTKAVSCPACGSKKLYKSLGDTICRVCGHQWSDEDSPVI